MHDRAVGADPYGSSGVPARIERPHGVLHVFRRNPVDRGSYQEPGVLIDNQDGRALDSRVACQPFEACVRVARRILVMREKVLEQLEPRALAHW